MEKKRLSEMLDKVYELEGMIGLALGRDEIPPRIIEIITDKTRDLQAYIDSDAVTKAEVAETETYYIVEEEPSDNSELSEPAEPAPEPTEPATIAPAPILQPASAPSPLTPRTTGKLVFSINDRYRYRRELFAGNDKDFKDALSKVAAMESFEEAEEYFLDELQWDPERPEVTDFMAVLRNYFEA